MPGTNHTFDLSPDRPDPPVPLERDPDAMALALASTNVGVFEYDASTARLRTSRRCRRILGLPVDLEPSADRLQSLVHPADRETVGTIFASLDPDGSGEFSVEHRIVRPDGACRWIEIRGRTVFEQRGGARVPVRSAGTMIDVTERRLAVEELSGTLDALRDSEQRFRTIFEQANDFIFTADLEQRVVTCNPAVAAALGLRPEEIVGRSIGEFIDPDQFERTTAMLMKKLREAGTTRYEVEVRPCGGRGRMTWEVNSRLTYGSDGRPNGLHAIARDVTEQRRTRHALERSEERFRDFANSIPALAWAADVDGAVTFFNRQWYEYSGQRPVDAIPHGWLDVLHPDDREGVVRLIGEHRAVAQPITIEYRLRRADGIHRWFLARLVPETDTAGRVTGWFGTATDVDDAKIVEQVLREQEQALRESDARLRIALDASRAGVIDWDVASGRVEWTESIYTLFGLEPGSVRASNEVWQRHVHPDDLPRVLAGVQESLESGRDFSADYRIIGADGVERWVQGRAIVLRGEGRPTRMIGALVDVTERRHANDRLREADRRKDEFLATLAHELRNPLAPIRTAAHVLGAPGLSPEQLASARQVIQRQVAHMAYLLDDLLDVARITRGKLQIRRHRAGLASIVDAAVEAARPSLERKGHSLAIELPEPDPVLDADVDRIAQVLSNLLTNAAKYTDPGGHVSLGATLDGGHVRITVRDDGIGLTPAALDSIFQMFSQVQDARHRSEGGLGIGLALVKGIVALHGGTVTARSGGPGCGSEFTVTLPLAPHAAGTTAAAADGAAAPVDASAAGRASEPPTAAHRRALRVLVADDNRDAADSLATLLELAGHRVVVANDGAEALRVAEDFHPDVAVLDIGMPDVSGYEVARRLRASEWARGLRLIALTGWGQHEDQADAYAAGFDDHVTKPADVDVLARLISRGVRVP